MRHACSSLGHSTASVRGAERSQRMGIVYGLALAGLGTLFLLDRLEVFDLRNWWRWWPLLGVAWGLSRVLVWKSAEDVGSGVNWMLVSVWIMVSLFGWFGLDWSQSWPLALVAIGAGMVTTALLRPHFARRKADTPANEEQHHV
jgi:hypothetical protein